MQRSAVTSPGAPCCPHRMTVTVTMTVKRLLARLTRLSFALCKGEPSPEPDDRFALLLPPSRGRPRAGGCGSCCCCGGGGGGCCDGGCRGWRNGGLAGLASLAGLAGLAGLNGFGGLSAASCRGAGPRETLRNIQICIIFHFSLQRSHNHLCLPPYAMTTALSSSPPRKRSRPLCARRTPVLPWLWPRAAPLRPVTSGVSLCLQVL